MFKSYIENAIKSYLNSPAYGSTPTQIKTTARDIFGADHHHLAVRKIANGFLMAYYDGSEPIYCATEKDLADQIISKAARSKMTPEKGLVAGDGDYGISNGYAAQSVFTDIYNNKLTGRI